MIFFLLMISVFLFFSTFLLSCKNNFIHFKFFYFDLHSIFMMIIFFLVILIIFISYFNSSNFKDLYFFSIVFSFFFFFIFFCFRTCRRFLFLLSLEICAFLMIFFIFNYAKDYDKISSSTFIFCINIVGSIPFMIFCWSCPLDFFSGGNTFNSFSSYLVFIFFSLILASKLPIFIFHFWLTKAHVRASGSGSIILARIILKIGSVGLIKWGPIFSFIFSIFSRITFRFFLILGIFMLVVINRFFDLKFLVACSSVSHISLTFPLLIIDSSSGLYSSLLIMVGHGVVSCVVFFLVTLAYERFQNRSIFSSKRIESDSSSFSLIIVLWMILNLGFPPFPRFFGELFFIWSLHRFSPFLSSIFFFCLIISGIFFVNFIMMIIFFKKNSFTWTNRIFSWISRSSIFIVLSFGSIIFFFN